MELIWKVLPPIPLVGMIAMMTMLSLCSITRIEPITTAFSISYIHPSMTCDHVILV